ncbi:MAG: hypothetical protein HYZ52_03575 [Candidatus Omnitrophica bacterium]|nr:hypothetical protein [Candidatus Omnitrophota bacterium]
MNSKTDLEKYGAAQAVLLSAMFGILTLSLVNLGTELSDAFKNAVHAVGKIWMPGAEGIGPYSGKETLALLAWLGSWFIFHRALRARQWNQSAVLVLFLLGIGAATTLLWPPVIHLMKPE